METKANKQKRETKEKNKQKKTIENNPIDLMFSNLVESLKTGKRKSSTYLESEEQDLKISLAKKKKIDNRSKSDAKASKEEILNLDQINWSLFVFPFFLRRAWFPVKQNSEGKTIQFKTCQSELVEAAKVFKEVINSEINHLISLFSIKKQIVEGNHISASKTILRIAKCNHVKLEEYEDYNERIETTFNKEYLRLKREELLKFEKNRSMTQNEIVSALKTLVQFESDLNEKSVQIDLESLENSNKALKNKKQERKADKNDILDQKSLSNPNLNKENSKEKLLDKDLKFIIDECKVIKLKKLDKISLNDEQWMVNQIKLVDKPLLGEIEEKKIN